jgi:Ser/Thr protein kinase RdoA (MazF antagonist)
VEKAIDPAAVFAAPAPDVDVLTAERIARRSFGVDGVFTPLESERDRNFRIEAPDEAYFLLKIHNAAEDLGFIEMQELALEHVRAADPSLPVPGAIPTADGGRHATWIDATGRTHVVRLLTYLPGTKVDSPDFSLDAIGRYAGVVARMGKALRTFSHPAARHPMLWDDLQVSAVRPLLGFVEDRKGREQVDRWLTRAEAHTVPILETLRAQVIHNDLTRDNVLFDERQDVSAILDFGDMVETAFVCDLANMLASLLGERPDFLAVAEAAIPGSVAVAPLEDRELEILADVVATRAVADIVVSEWRKVQHPENADYITHWEAGSWVILERLDELGVENVARRFAGFRSAR